MRLFIAILLSNEMKTSLIEAQNVMYERGLRGNYSPEENLHLTLAFIGDLPRAEPVLDALSTVSFRPFALTLEGIGRFGDLWWAGLQDSAALNAVARRVRRALAENCIPFDRKRFSPHITLVRKASRDAAGIGIAPAAMRVEAISLMRSDRGKNGMIYKELGRIEAEASGEGDYNMKYQIIQIDRDSWRIEDSGVRFFLLTGTERALLVDSGRSVHNARDIASGLTNLPICLLNTHGDMDHVGSNAQFDAFYMHPEEEENFRRGGREGEILPVREGERIDLGERVLEVIHLPGHTPGSIALLDLSRRVLISGDPIQDGRIFMFGRFRNMEKYIRSLEHLQAWRDRFDEIWPSHGSFPVFPELIDKLHDGAIQVLEGSVEGEAMEVHGNSIRAYDVGAAVFLCDP